MIIDGHAYCFPPLNSPAGYPSLDEKMRVFHRELGGHHQPVWRVRDRAPADNSTLVDPETQELRDVEWSYQRERFTWSYHGETYTKQYFPPMLHNLECPPELLLAEMDHVGVDMAVLHTSPHLGLLNDFYAEAVAKYPSRLMRLISLPDARIPADPEAAAREVETQVAAGGRCGFQFFPRYYYEAGHTEPWDDGAMRPFWRALAALGIPVHFTLLGARGQARYSSAEHEGYLDEHRILQRWMDRYPETTVVITHGLPWRSFLDGGRIVLPDAIWEVFEAPNCHLQLLFPIQLGGMWEYPWREAVPTIKECVQRVGADRLIWGTDLPMVARFCTYRQTLDQYRAHCDFLSESELQDIIGGTAARVMGLGA